MRQDPFRSQLWGGILVPDLKKKCRIGKPTFYPTELCVPPTQITDDLTNILLSLFVS